MALIAVYRAAGDPETAALELAAARLAFERLGTVLDVARAVEAQASAAPAHAAEPEVPRAETRTCRFTAIVRSTQLIEAIGGRGVDGSRPVARPDPPRPLRQPRRRRSQ